VGGPGGAEHHQKNKRNQKRTYKHGHNTV